MTQTREDQEYHDSIILEWANRLSREGWNVQADVKGYPKPLEINGKIPDITATHPIWGKLIREVETDTSYDKEHTRQQYVAFTNNPWNAEFKVIVPRNCLIQAEAKAKEWGLFWIRFLAH